MLYNHRQRSKYGKATTNTYYTSNGDREDAKKNGKKFANISVIIVHINGQ